MLKQNSFFLQFVAPLLIFSISLGPTSFSGHPEPSRGTLRPELDRSGLDKRLSPAGQEEKSFDQLAEDLQNETFSDARAQAGFAMLGHYLKDPSVEEIIRTLFRQIILDPKAEEGSGDDFLRSELLMYLSFLGDPEDLDVAETTALDPQEEVHREALLMIPRLFYQTEEQIAKAREIVSEWGDWDVQQFNYDDDKIAWVQAVTAVLDQEQERLRQQEILLDPTEESGARQSAARYLGEYPDERPILALVRAFEQAGEDEFLKMHVLDALVALLTPAPFMDRDPLSPNNQVRIPSGSYTDLLERQGVDLYARTVPLVFDYLAQQFSEIQSTGGVPSVDQIQEQVATLSPVERLAVRHIALLFEYWMQRNVSSSGPDASEAGQEERFDDDPDNVTVKRVSQELEELSVGRLGFPGANMAVKSIRFYGPAMIDNRQAQPVSVTVKSTGRVLYHRAVSQLKFGRRPADGDAFVLTGLLHGTNPSIFTRFWLNAETGKITYKAFRSTGLEEVTAEQMKTQLVERIHQSETFLPSSQRAGDPAKQLPGTERLFHTEVTPSETVLHLGEDRYHLDVRLKLIEGVLAVILHNHLADSGALFDVASAYEEGIVNLFSDLQREAVSQGGQWIGLNQRKFRTRIYLWVPKAVDSGQNALVEAMKRVSFDINKLFGTSRYTGAVAQVISPSVAERNPSVHVLSDLMPRYFFMDPGGESSVSLAIRLRDSRPHRLTAAYYGTDEEFARFQRTIEQLDSADRLTLVRGDSSGGDSFRGVLQKLFASLGAYSELKFVVNKVQWDLFEQDLKLLGEA